MVTSIKQNRNFPVFTLINGKSKESSMTCEYTLWFEDGKLVEVRNGFNFICESNSEAWEHFSKLF